MDRIESLLALLDSLRRLGVDVDKVLIDRGYSQLPGLGIELSKRMIQQSIKLKSNQLGPHGTPIPGTVMIDGGLFVGWMPKHLWQLPNFDLWITAEETVALAERYEERLPYAFSPKGKPDWERGVQQYRGPAASGKVSCAKRPESLRTMRAIASRRSPSMRLASPCSPVRAAPSRASVPRTISICASSSSTARRSGWRTIRGAVASRAATRTSRPRFQPSGTVNPSECSRAGASASG
ncbi:hypothetical protein [uncultured Tessaracoccus sp.]|uniref:hypothetical protein n=1 Tax=uncultured Tessaracoccus sp. TaxID=905023 RepID=UPI00260F2EA0|nr:hypothetical protein [uncultured Tessaracoccus sp.]